jgi:hypothetical protein
MQYRTRLIRRCAWLAPFLALAVLLPFSPAGPARAASLTPDRVDAFPFQVRIGAPGACIKVTWARPSRIPSSLVLGSVIWRSESGAPLEIVGGFDADTKHGFLDTESARTPTVWDGTPGGDAGARVTLPSVPGLTPGRQYRYQVANAFRVGLLQPGDDLQPGTAQLMTALSNGSRFVTAIAPPSISGINGQPPSGSPQVDLSSVLVEWQQTPGADAYVIWASTDPSFRKGRRVASGQVRTIPVDMGGPQLVSHTIDLSRGRLRRANRIYISVGARNTQDRVKPKPFGAIFSAPALVVPETGPPPAP